MTLQVEIRSDSVMIDGYVNAVERDSRVLPKSMCPDATGPFVERVRAHVFERALGREPCVELRFNHKKRLGDTADGSITLYEDAIGLRATAKIVDPEVIERARNNELRGWSFGFKKLADSWETLEDKDYQRRYLEDLEIYEVSLLTACPAYIATTVELRGDETIVTEERTFDDEIRIIDVQNTNSDEPLDYTKYINEIEVLKFGGKHEAVD